MTPSPSSLVTLVCPACKQAVVPDGEDWRCRVCQRPFTRNQGVLSFLTPEERFNESVYEVEQIAAWTASARDEDGEPNSPELHVKLTECFTLMEHPHICEGKLPVKLWLCAPDGKRLEATFNWPAFKTNTYPKLKPALQKKYPGMTWL